MLSKNSDFYHLNLNKINTIDDVKEILQLLNIVILPNHPNFENVRKYFYRYDDEEEKAKKVKRGQNIPEEELPFLNAFMGSTKNED